MKYKPSQLSRVLGQLQRRGASTSTSTSTNAPPAVIFSGIQPTGIPHLGNYLGALQQWKRMQDEAAPGTRLIYSVVDLHAITLPQQVGQLRQWRREMLAALLAIGLDPGRSTIFYQSAVGLFDLRVMKRWNEWSLILRCRFRLILSSCGF